MVDWNGNWNGNWNGDQNGGVVQTLTFFESSSISIRTEGQNRDVKKTYFVNREHYLRGEQAQKKMKFYKGHFLQKFNSILYNK